MPDWLPPLVLLEESNGNWKEYAEKIYGFFKADFVDARPTYQGIRLGLRKHPVVDGKETTFWHLISEGKNEEERTPDMRRCERIRWVRPLIERAGSDPEVVVWRQSRNGKSNIAISLNDYSYMVFLGERSGQSGDYLIPLTAYTVEYENRRAKYKKEYEAFIANANNKDAGKKA